MILRMFLIGALLAAPILLSLGSQKLAETVGPPSGLPTQAVEVPLVATAPVNEASGRARRAPVPESVTTRSRPRRQQAPRPSMMPEAGDS